MHFAGHYLEKHALFSPFIFTPPHPDLYISIIIPCYNEPDLISSLESLWNCHRPTYAVEVIVIVNAFINAPTEAIRQNLKTIHDFSHWEPDHRDEKLRFFLIYLPDLPRRDAGVGLARKAGMDEAIRRFDVLNRPGGIMIGFDADSTCNREYLTEIEKHMQGNPKTPAFSIHFEHPLKGTAYESFVYKAIVQYELYLRYYIHALRYTGHPHAFQTIGSAFGVRADVYCKQGGMNKRKAGEDFYFLQKIIPLGNYTELNTAVVFPSPRTSDRVPFGTGATVSKMKRDNSQVYNTYSFQAFVDLKQFFDMISGFYTASKGKTEELMTQLSPALSDFLQKSEITKHIEEINKNSSTLFNFQIRFFRWFNAFMVLKYMNFSHEQLYRTMPVTEATTDFLKIINGHQNTENDVILLLLLREKATSARI